MLSIENEYHKMTDSMALSTDTDGTTETEKTWYNMLFLCHISRTDISTSLNLKIGVGLPKTEFRSLSAFVVLFTERDAEESKHGATKRAPNFDKHVHSCDVHFALGVKQILETRCIK